MPNNNLALTLDHIIEALRDCQSLSPKPLLADAKTQIDLPERILTRTRADASGVGVSPEVLVLALLQAFNEIDKSVKINLAKALDRLLNPASAERASVQSVKGV